ncbi:hypothetical protein GZH49_37530 [Nocardia terpenica]|uniref:hypothetical protein n=1 Tax=Nocardia terpenica TaxID=455432 RepID=UPI002FDFD8E5
MTRPSIILGYSPAQQRNLRRLAEAGMSGLTVSALAADGAAQGKSAADSSLASLERLGLVQKRIGQETVWTITEKGCLADELIQARRAKLEKRETPRAETLIERAEQAGYRLVRTTQSTHGWALLDREDGECIHSAPTLAQIERWLSE